jgi:hypothetical protein
MGKKAQVRIIGKIRIWLIPSLAALSLSDRVRLGLLENLALIVLTDGLNIVG